MSEAETASLGGLDLQNGLPDVRPQDDLYQHVNGRWIRETSVPDDKAAIGTMLSLRDSVEQQLHDIVEKLVAQPAPEGSEARKVGYMYASFLDTETVERLGSTPLHADLDAIAAISSTSELARQLGRLERVGVQGAFRPYISTDDKQADRYLLHFVQGGLCLPDRSYYLDETFAAIMPRYQEHVETMLGLAGVSEPAAKAAAIVALETRLAGAHWDRAKARDATLGYTLVSRAGLSDLAPGFDWDAWLAGLDTPASTLAEVVVKQPDFLTAFAAALAEVPLEDWKSWLSWSLIHTMAPLLSSAFVTENHAFFGATLTGVSAQRDRWKRGLQAVGGALGDALGKIYVAEYFPPRSKEFMLGVVANLVEAYRQSILTLDWMGEETKQRALQKLELFHPKIGYPDNWREYDAVVISRDDLVGNVQRAESASVDRDLRKLGGPVDRGEWFLSPQTVNAYYNVGMNDIVFPAAILQPPMFDVDADPAINFGAIGAVIGHEIGHGFDDQGAKYNGTGNLEDWWTDSDRVAFEERSGKLIAQFSAIEPRQLPGQHVNGGLTVGENIGDLGGLTIAHRAYLNYLDGSEAPVIDGLTGSQRFFISWARIWRGKIRDAELARRLVVDPHSPDEFRCNTITPNLDEFCEAFGVSEGDGMWLDPTSRVRIW